MPFSANIGRDWACYQVFGIDEESNLIETPFGTVQCDGSVLIPDGDGFNTMFRCVISANLADAGIYWNGNLGNTSAAVVYFQREQVSLQWSGNLFRSGSTSIGTTYVIQLDGTISTDIVVGGPVVFWPSLNWSGLPGGIKDLSALCCVTPPQPPSSVPTPNCPVDPQSACDPTNLMKDARCFKCIPTGMQESVITYLLAVWAGGTTDLWKLLKDAACFDKCIPPGMQDAVQSYLLSVIAGINLSESLLGATCLDKQIPRGMQKEVEISLLCQIDANL